MAVDWGDVPGWFSSVGTVGALVGTLWVINRDRRLQREDHEERLWNRALLVEVLVTPAWTSAELDEDGRPKSVITANVTNGGSRPIQDARLVVTSKDGTDVLDHSYGTIPALSVGQVHFPPRDDLYATHWQGGGINVAWRLTFVDISGRRWERTSDRELRTIA